jgi:hypothetical protein
MNLNRHIERHLREKLSKVGLNITIVQHGYHLPHVQCPKDIEAPSMFATAYQCQLLQYKYSISFTKSLFSQCSRYGQMRFGH